MWKQKTMVEQASLLDTRRTFHTPHYTFAAIGDGMSQTRQWFFHPIKFTAKNAFTV